MTTMFISYRQTDSPGDCRQLAERLKEAFGPENVFLDIVDLKPGQNWWKVAHERISSSDVLLVPVGQSWVSVQGKKGRRLDDPADPIRMEIGLALEKNIPIIPVLVEEARMPEAEQLPPELREFANLVAHELRHGHFRRDVDELIELLGGSAPHGRGAATDEKASGGFAHDLLAALGKGLGAKLGERLAGAAGTGGAAVRSPSPLPAPQATQPQLNLSGTWQSANGLQHFIWHQANVVTIETRNPYGAVIVRAQGQIAGMQLHLVYDAQYQPPYVTRGEARCMVSPDGMFITGQSMDPALGMQAVQLRRVG